MAPDQRQKHRDRSSRMDAMTSGLDQNRGGDQPSDNRRRIDAVDIDNPLRGRDLEPAINHFAAITRLEDLKETLLRGAYLAEDPDGYSQVSGLTKRDLEVLKREQNETNPFKLLAHIPKELRTIILACSLGAITQGWDQSAMAGANQYWPSELGLDLTRTRDTWIFGFINASSFLFAAIVGAWFSDPLNEWLMGRRSAIFIGAIFSLIPMVGAAVCETWQQLLACRILLGIGIGCKAAVAPIYASETAPTNIRGGVVLNWQFSIGVGFVLGHSMNLALLDATHFNWRLQMASAALPAIPLLFLIYTVTESPRFLIKQGKWRRAWESLKLINETEVQAARDLYLIHVQNELTKMKWYGASSDADLDDLFPSELDEKAAPKVTTEDTGIPPKSGINGRANTYWKRLANLFTVPRIRRATTAASVVMICQQLSGINVIAFYAAILLPAPKNPSSVRATNRNALWLSWGVSVLDKIMSIPVFMTIDRWGRRTLCLCVAPILGLCMFGAGLCFLQDPNSSAFTGSLFLFIFLFQAFFPALGVVPFAYSAEVFPTVNREVGMSLATFMNYFGAGCVGLFVPFLLNELGGIGLFELFAGLNIVAYILMFIFVYETKQESLERLDGIFEIRTATHLRYQLTEVVPWCLRNAFKPAYKRENLDSLLLWNRKRQGETNLGLDVDEDHIDVERR